MRRLLRRLRERRGSEDRAPAAPGRRVSRRELLRTGGLGVAGLASAGVVGRAWAQERAVPSPTPTPTPTPDVDLETAIRSEGYEFTCSIPGLEGHLLGTVGAVDHERNGFDPTDMLDDWDFGETSELPDGQTLRTYDIFAVDKEIEIAAGIFFPAWTYNGRVPGPTLRCKEGDRIRIRFENGGTHPHTIHFHGIHPASMDGVPAVGAGVIEPGQSTVYEFDAFPFGCHLYHCHSTPLKRHIHKGLYGAFIVDPDPELHPEGAEAAARRTFEGAKEAGIRELMMVMNGFDTNFDGENEVYSVNTVAFHYALGNNPIRVGNDEDVRLYLVNVTEFDPINSFHLHANFFDYYDHGTTLTPTLPTVDTIMQCQAQRGILEFSFRDFEPGLYMFHAHQSEFVELGWMGFFDVVEGRS